MSEMKHILSNIVVIKRDGKKVEFNESKIAIAIKKGFDSLKTECNDNRYTEKDINKIYNIVLEKIIEIQKDKIKIEDIQDMIE